MLLKRQSFYGLRALLVLLLTGQLACSGLFGGGGGVSESGRPAPHFRPGFNLFSPKQDVEIGKQSAQEIAQQVQLLRDEAIVNYVRQLGGRLAAKAPGEDFPYQFNVIATREINAFALPGGFIFVNAGTIAAAKNEGELAGVIAHEITHVALRHGTNQASKAYLAKAGIGILGSVAGNDSDLGQVVESIGGAGANMLFLKFGRTAERQADLEGARVMAEAGYDPHDMANFFKTLQAQGGQRGPEFMSDHPDPGNRVASINDALPSLPVQKNPLHNSQEFQQVKARLTGQALNESKEPARVGPRNPDDVQQGARPPMPDTTFKEYRTRDGAFAFECPQNWDGLASGQDESNLIFAPKGAYGQRGEAVYVTHGVFVGTLAAQGQADLESANNAFVQQQINVNQDFRVQRAPQRINFNGRTGFATVVAGPSPVTGVVEIDVIYTTATADGRLFYLITIAPEDEFQKYQPAFQHIVGSLKME
jgi:Zn-dependent protease with chaperone function